MNTSSVLSLDSEERLVLTELCRVAPDKSDTLLSVNEWLDSFYHTGFIGSSLYPYWRDRLNEVFSDKGVNFSEVIVTGSLSGGKSFFSLVCWLRLLYIFSRTPNLHSTLSLSPGSRIFFAYLSVSATEAELTGFGDFRNMIDSIPYFKECFPRNLGKSSVLEFPNGLTVIYGSDILHFIGSNLYSLIFDETNFVRKGSGNPGDVRKAFDIYHSSRLRIKTRFGSSGSNFPGMNFLVSSTTHQSSFMEKAIQAVRGSTSSKVISSRVYECKPKGSYSDKKFLFFVGDDRYPPCTVRSASDLLGKVPPDLIRVFNPELPIEFYAALPEDLKLRFVLVPVDYLEECSRYPDRALSDIIGYSHVVKSSFFSSKANFTACLDLNRKHPFTRESLIISLRDNISILSYLDVPLLKSYVGSHPCFIHVDQSVSGDSTGIVCSHPVMVNGYVFVYLDFALRIDPPGNGDQISLAKCCDFVIDLVNAGINVAKVTYDKYQSTASIQRLNQHGIHAEHFSTDASDSSWVQVSDLFFLKRVAVYRYAPLEEEWFSLIHDREKHKVDHPKEGSKDVADAFVGSVYNSLMSMVASEASVISVNRMESIFAKLRNPGFGKEDLVTNLLGIHRYSLS